MLAVNKLVAIIYSIILWEKYAIILWEKLLFICERTNVIRISLVHAFVFEYYLTMLRSTQ